MMYVVDGGGGYLLSILSAERSEDEGQEEEGYYLCGGSQRKFRCKHFFFLSLCCLDLAAAAAAASLLPSFLWLRLDRVSTTHSTRTASFSCSQTLRPAAAKRKLARVSPRPTDRTGPRKERERPAGKVCATLSRAASRGRTISLPSEKRERESAHSLSPSVRVGPGRRHVRAPLSPCPPARPQRSLRKDDFPLYA